MNQIEIFKNSITVLDTETTNLLPDLCEIVEVAGTLWDGSKWRTKSMLLGTEKGIPPEASAKNNISNRMIGGLPTFKEDITNVKVILNWPSSKWYVAHNADYDRTALKLAFNNANDISICEDKSRWICTWRLSKQILNHDFNDIQYGLNYLRYKLELPIDDKVGVHRAAADTLVTATLLDKLISIAIHNNQIDSNEDIGLQLNELSWKTIPIKTWPFGKHRGQLLEDLDNDYYLWALKNLPQFDSSNALYDIDLAESVCKVLEKRVS